MRALVFLVRARAAPFGQAGPVSGTPGPAARGSVSTPAMSWARARAWARARVRTTVPTSRGKWLVVPRPLPVPVRAAIAVGVLGWLAFAASTVWPGRTPSPVWDIWVYDGVSLGAATVVMARALLVRAERIAWAALGSALFASASGDVVYSWLSAAGEPTFPSVADVPYLTFYPSLYLGLVLLLRHRLRSMPASAWLDGLVAACAMGAMVAATAFEPIAAGAAQESSPTAVAVALAYPLGDLTLLAVTSGALALVGWRADRRWWALSAVLVTYALVDTLYLLRVTDGSYTEGTWIDALWPAAAVGLTMIAWQPSRQITSERVHGWPALIPALVASVGAIVLLTAAAGPRLPHLAVALAAVTLLAATARFALSFRELAVLADTHRQAITDELTGLGNRRALTRAIGMVPKHASAGLLLIDLDRFKEVNDSLGHHVGDELLVQIARRLRAAVADHPGLVVVSLTPSAAAHPSTPTAVSAVIARPGGDEFAVLLSATSITGGTTAKIAAVDGDGRKPTGSGDGRRPGPGLTELAHSLARSISDRLAAPFALDDITLHVRGSVGIALHPQHTTGPGQLLQRADVAMYKAKSSRAGVCAYRSEDDPHSRERLQLIEELRAGLAAGQVICHFQPILDTADGRVRAVEALCRWQHPRLGLLTPDRFLHLAEHAGLMRELTATVLGRALDPLPAWKAVHAGLTVSVNLSPTNLMDLDLPRTVAGALAARDIAPGHLTVEITENLFMSNTTPATQVLAELRQLGVETAIDDYGTGYSSLAYLQDLEVDELKLDRSFIAELSSSRRARAIVASTIALASNLGLRFVAEGVETEQTAETLRWMGCPSVQGFLYSRPVPPEALTDWLTQHMLQPAYAAPAAGPAVVPAARAATASDPQE